MICIFFLLAIISLLISKTIIHKYININTMFTLLWCLFAGISCLGLWGIDKPTTSTLFLVMISIITVNIFYLLTVIIFKYSKSQLKQKFLDPKDPKKNNMVKKPVHLWLVIFIQLVAWGISFKYIPKAIYIINEYGYSSLRYYAFNASPVYMSTVELMFFQGVVQPAFFAINIIISANLFLSKEKKRFYLLLVALINMTLYSVMFGGREIIILFFLDVIFAFIVINRKKLFFAFSKNKKIIILLIVILCVINYLVSLRKFSNTSPLETMLIYCSGSFTYLDKLIQNVPWRDEYLYGRALFGFITSLASVFLYIFFKVPYNPPVEKINYITAPFTWIGVNRKFNALATMLFPFLMDFGYMGAFIGSAWFGILIAVIECNFYKKRTWFSLCIYILFLYLTFVSFMNYYLVGYVYSMTIVYLILFIKKNKQINMED